MVGRNGVVAESVEFVEVRRGKLSQDAAKERRQREQHDLRRHSYTK